MSAQSKRRGSPFDAAAREHFAALIRIHGIRGASEPVSKSTLGKIAKEYCIQLRVGRRTYASMPMPQPRLSSDQVKRLTAMLTRGPKEAGYRTNSWTARQICEMVQRSLGVKCLPHHLKEMFAEVSLGPAVKRVMNATWRRTATDSPASVLNAA